MSEQPTPPVVQSRRSRGNPRFGDMARSVLLVVVIVLVVWGFSELTDEETQPPVRTVDYQGQLAAARDAADYDVLAPSELGSGWRATSVDLQVVDDEVHWHLGMLTPQDRYVGLEQYGSRAGALAGDHLDGLRRTGTTSIEGRAWQVWVGEVDEALVHRSSDVTTIVVGTAGRATLEHFAEALASDG